MKRDWQLVSVRVPNEDHKALKEIANEFGLPIGTLVRIVAQQKLVRPYQQGLSLRMSHTLTFSEEGEE